MFIALFLAGLVLGAGLIYWHKRTLAHAKRRVPKKWPLAVRPLANSEERRVWAWLNKVMFDQQVLLKLPVTRFTAPANRDEASHWFELLNGVYCTFTVCSPEGRVIGCVDLAGPLRLRSNQILKHSLLSQLGVRYRVFDSTKLPHPTQIRADFLGQDAAKDTEQEVLDARFKDVKKILQTTLDRQRNNKGKREKASQQEAVIVDSSEFQESRLTSGWEQNSFLTPLDSRRAELHAESAAHSSNRVQRG